MHPLEKMIYKKGYTVKSFCECCGIDRSSLEKYFSGRTKTLRGDTVYKISNTLNEPFDVVMAICMEGL